MQDEPNLAGLITAGPDVSTLPTPARAANAERRLRLRHRQRDKFRRRVLTIADAVAIGCALPVAMAATGVRRLSDHLVWAAPALLGWLLLLSAYGLYERDARRLGHLTVDELPRLFHAVVTGSLLLWAFISAGPAPGPGAGTMLVFGACALLTITLARWLARGYMSWRLAPERVLVIGAPELTGRLSRKMWSHPEHGLEPAERLVDVPDEEELERLSVILGVDRIVLTDGSADTDTLLTLLAASRRLLLNVSVVPSVFEAMGPEIEVGDLEGVTVLSLSAPVLSRGAQAVKRGIDVVGAAAGLLALSPLLVVIAVAIKLDSPGPVLFRQRRVGRSGRPFQMVKFRTMVDGAERLRAQVIQESADPHWVKLDHDPRITRLGALLRRTSLDELPQFWNVLVGDMSLVGPRPLPVAEDRLIEGWRRGRLDLRPGITGYWQVLGRTNVSFEEMVKLDYVYVTNWSLWNDARLILRTLPAVFGGRGVN